MIRRLLIANRGEIACRIMRSARGMGMECAAVFSDADRGALHTLMADTALPIGPSESRHSYLDHGRLLDAARDWGADAVHPGYGFLSENADFARAVQDAGMIFVGPEPDSIAAMGDKSHAKAMMEQAGVPVLPGYDGADQNDETLRREAARIGYPVLIKAVSGGGGRGLRVLREEAELLPALQSVRREAEAAFGDPRVLLEKYLDRARHVEVQVFGDGHGGCLHLYTRDCSLQRRHQKLVEEAPAPALSEDIRRALQEAAVQAARAIDYRGAGTVEFLLAEHAFHFMEMNTRLQVEHPVTEAVTGVDLVEWQLRIAAGEPLPLRQDEIPCRGSAIEVRLNAENPAADFLPSTGVIRRMRWPRIPGLRIDSGYRSGDRVAIHYDSLLAKLVLHGPEREPVLRKMALALSHTRIDGPASNRHLLQAIVEHPEFLRTGFDTGFLESSETALLRGAEILALQEDQGERDEDEGQADWGELTAWRNLAHNPFSRRYHLYGETAPGHRAGDAVSGRALQTRLQAPLPGTITAIHARAGETVEADQPLLVMEAMKMEHTVTAGARAIIRQIHCAVHETVRADQLLISFADVVDNETGEPSPMEGA